MLWILSSHSKIIYSALLKKEQVFLFITSPSAPLTDHFFSLERRHPAGHRLHGGQPELQARERRVDAGFLCGGEHLFPQVAKTADIIHNVNVIILTNHFQNLN